MKALLSYKFRKKHLKLLIFLTDRLINPFWWLINDLSYVKGFSWVNDALIQDFYYRRGYGSLKGYWNNSIFIYSIHSKLRRSWDWFILKFLNPPYQDKIINWFISYSDSKFLWNTACNYKLRNREQDTRYFNLFVIPYTNYFKLTMVRYIDKDTSHGLNMFLHSFAHMNDSKEEFADTFKQENTILFKGFIWNKIQLLRFMRAYRCNYGRIYTYKQRYECRQTVNKWMKTEEN